VHSLDAPVLDAPVLVRYGIPELVYGAQPAAAADFVGTVDGSFYARLVSVFCRLVADANVASREVVVEYRNAADERFALAGAATTLTAGQTGDYFFSAFLSTDIFTVDGSALAPLPPLMLVPTFDFRIHVVNAQVGDQLSMIRYVQERFYTTDTPSLVAP
jgi:hypothetical protein